MTRVLMTRVSKTVAARCSLIADTIVPEYRNGKRRYSCTSIVAKRWLAAWDGARMAQVRAPKQKPGKLR